MTNYLVIDTETTNGFDDPLAYDIGWAVVDKDCVPIVTRSFVVEEIFLDKSLMAEAFFADKIPQYWDDIKSGHRKLTTLRNIAKALRKDCADYGVVGIYAHNMRFDYLSTNTTQRFLTQSRYRYFFPYGIEICDTLKMARQTFGKNEDYKKFCLENDFCMGNGRPRLTAEILYRYLRNDPTFEESHTGLEDVLIEKEILKACLEMDSTIEQTLWAR